LTVGSMFSGIHPVHDFTMFRRIQVNKQDPVYQHFKTYNPHMCSKSAWAATDTDEIITFPVLVSPSAKTKSMLTDIEHLEIIRRTQKNWVTPGITEVNSKPISHSVSCTVQVDDWQEVAKYLAENKDSFCAVSLIARNSDKQYKQAPNESVTTAQDALEFNRLMDNYTLVDYTQLVEQTDQTKHQEQFACIAGACTI
jgi:ribonucleoside-triphosphate reductase (thioredoxin)